MSLYTEDEKHDEFIYIYFTFTFLEKDVTISTPDKNII